MLDAPYATQSGLRMHVNAMCEIGNRFPGSPGEAAARKYILEQFHAAGLSNVRTEEFEILAYQGARAEVEAVSGGWAAAGPNGLQFSASETVEAPAVYLGQPRSVAEIEALDPAPDLDGRIAVVDTYWPYLIGPHLAARGCAGIVIVSPDPGGTVASFTSKFYPSEGLAPVLDIPGVSISRTDAQRLLAHMCERTVTLRLSHEADYSTITTANVVGEAAGSSSVDEQVVIGAHYDTQASGVGACDNATGIAALLEGARWCVSNPQGRSITFAAFADEEHGLNGSVDYCTRHNDRLQSTVGMVCLDALAWLYPWQALHVDSAIRDFALECARQCGWEPAVTDARQLIGSDHNAFIEAGVPACWYWHYPPQHPGYHGVGDSVDLLNYDLVESAALVSIHTAVAMANAESLSAATASGRESHEPPTRAPA